MRPRDGNALGLLLVCGATCLALLHHRAVRYLFGWFKRLSSRTLRLYKNTSFFFFLPKRQVWMRQIWHFELQEEGEGAVHAAAAAAVTSDHHTAWWTHTLRPGHKHSQMHYVQQCRWDIYRKKTAARKWWHPTYVTQTYWAVLSLRNFGILSFGSPKKITTELKKNQVFYVASAGCRTDVQMWRNIAITSTSQGPLKTNKVLHTVMVNLIHISYGGEIWGLATPPVPLRFPLAKISTLDEVKLK